MATRKTRLESSEMLDFTSESNPNPAAVVVSSNTVADAGVLSNNAPAVTAANITVIGDPLLDGLVVSLNNAPTIGNVASDVVLSDPAVTAVIGDPVPDGLVVSLNPNVPNARILRQTEALLARLGVIRNHFVNAGNRIADSPNDYGYQIGDNLVVTWDKKNFHPFKPGGKRLKSSKLENKTGVVIGTTATMVDIVMGRLFGDLKKLTLLRKKNHNVSKVRGI